MCELTGLGHLGCLKGLCSWHLLLLYVYQINRCGMVDDEGTGQETFSAL